jgi:hypothetical protein
MRATLANARVRRAGDAPHSLKDELHDRLATLLQQLKLIRRKASSSQVIAACVQN